MLQLLFNVKDDGVNIVAVVVVAVDIDVVLVVNCSFGDRCC